MTMSEDSELTTDPTVVADADEAGGGADVETEAVTDDARADDPGTENADEAPAAADEVASDDVAGEAEAPLEAAEGQGEDVLAGD